MLFGHKIHPLNFEYAARLQANADGVQISGDSFSARIYCHEITASCTRLRFENERVPDRRQCSDGILERYRSGRPVPPQTDGEAVFITPGGAITLGPSWLTIRLADGARLSTTEDGFGFNGESFMLNFAIPDASGGYGFGERARRFNKIGDSLDFWTVDVVHVFRATCEGDDFDPMYVAIPLAIVRTGGRCTGLYFDNPGRSLIDVGKTRPGQLMYQALAGSTDLYLIAGPSLQDVVRRFTGLTGRAEIPPLWSLGYHQCRWGYRSAAEFTALKETFEQCDIPVSALWYDIDYMDGYRLFTWNQTAFPDPAALNRSLKEAGIRTVAIVDPGVKREAGYRVYDRGQARKAFCKTRSGRDYVGRVWPGDVVFPDFTLARTRDWWAELLAEFVRDSALDGVWLDMNDPATGFSAVEDMLFQDGQVAHDRYHNQYAHFMAKASHEAFARLDPNARPFLLTRSGFTGTQRYSAVWTGDNASNWRHLRMSIPCSLNLGLSGIAFNGPDVGGFLGHATPELLIRWYQAAFLFPFFRNHSVRDSKSQEPWQFGAECLAVARAAIITRYRLLPYLYQCFFTHYLTGDPVLRPLLYHYDDEAFEHLDDQYLLGDSLLAAPILTGEEERQSVMIQGVRYQRRHITLPPGWWFDLNRGQWLEGGRTLLYAAALAEAPLFVRDGAMIPCYPGPLRNSQMDFGVIELHIFVRQRSGELQYFIDDLETRRYQAGDYNTAAISVTLAENGEIRLTIAETGPLTPGTVQFRPVCYGLAGSWMAVIADGTGSRRQPLSPATRRWLCQDIPVLV